MEFFPANSNNLAEENKARIELKPDLFKDGIYKLRIQAQDASGNVSGNIDYNISFEVISKAMISNVLNYPNPFSTSTQFVYTLTGVEVPAYYKIQIMTVSGRIIREIDQTELGELRIGTHKTDFAWDGTDQFGDRLANGVYLYRFVTKNSDGSDYENFQRDSVDKFFQKGFGKMVLLK
jgi:flagellar hook assembly protein FlgD